MNAEASAHRDSFAALALGVSGRAMETPVTTRRRLLLAAAGTWATRAFAADPGSNVVRIVVPYAAGSSMDVMGRVIGDKVAERWHRTFVVENRGGAGGNVGGEYVAQARPDGDTLLLASMAVATNRYLYPSMKWDPLKDLRPVIRICEIPNVIVVPTDSPSRNLRQFIELARTRPPYYGSAGAGTSMHLGAELFMRAAGIRMTHVPYRGSTLALTDLIGGRIDVLFATLASALPQIQAGQVRALGLTTSRRSECAPEIPTVSESGVHGFEMAAWYGILAPSRTSEAIVERMNEDMRWALDDPAIRQRFEKSMCMHVVGSTRQEFEDFLTRESAHWGEVIQRASIRLE